MGIEGLLPFLKPIMTSMHISAFEGKTCAVDTMSWLYRGCYSCITDDINSLKPKEYLNFIYKSILMLRRHNIKPLMILDGRRLIAKAKTEENRKKNKLLNREKAKEFLEKGDINEAKKYLSRAIHISKEMIYFAIDLFRQLNVDYLVAPYEADSQISYLQISDQVDFAISEDSDLVSYGCRKIMFKLNLIGQGDFLNLDFYKSEDAKPLRMNLKDKALRSFLNFSFENTIAACILSGCDYLPSIKGIGIKKAVDFLDRCGKLEAVVMRLKFEKTFMGRIPEFYAETALKISLVFKYQTVYDPVRKSLVPIRDFPENVELTSNELTLIGEKFQNVEDFIKGKLDLKTLSPRQKDYIVDLKEFTKNPVNSTGKFFKAKNVEIIMPIYKPNKNQDKDDIDPLIYAENFADNQKNDEENNFEEDDKYTGVLDATGEEAFDRNKYRRQTHITPIEDYKLESLYDACLMFAEEAGEVEEDEEEDNDNKDEYELERTEQKKQLNFDLLEVSDKKEKNQKTQVQDKTSTKEKISEKSGKKEERKTEIKEEKSPIVPKKKKNNDVVMDSLFKINNQQSDDEDVVLNVDKTKKKESLSKINNGKETQGKLILSQKPIASKKKNNDENKNLINKKFESTKKVKTEPVSKISNYFIKDLRKTFIN